MSCFSNERVDYVDLNKSLEYIMKRSAMIYFKRFVSNTLYMYIYITFEMSSAPASLQWNRFEWHIKYRGFIGYSTSKIA